MCASARATARTSSFQSKLVSKPNCLVFVIYQLFSLLSMRYGQCTYIYDTACTLATEYAEHTKRTPVERWRIHTNTVARTPYKTIESPAASYLRSTDHHATTTVARHKSEAGKTKVTTMCFSLKHKYFTIEFAYSAARIEQIVKLEINFTIDFRPTAAEIEQIVKLFENIKRI